MFGETIKVPVVSLMVLEVKLNCQLRNKELPRIAHRSTIIREQRK